MREYGRKYQERVKARYNTDQQFRSKRAQYLKEWIAKNPEFAKERQRVQALSRKGLTPKDYDALLEQQNDGCYLCGGRPSRTPYLHVDHDHKTGVVRGLLCDSCNLGLGKLQDSAEILTRAVAYLQRDTGFRIRTDRRAWIRALNPDDPDGADEADEAV